MVSHDSVAGHGHVGSHAIGMAGGHWTHCKQCPEQSPRQNIGRLLFVYLRLSKGPLSLMPMCWVWSTGRELCIPARAARLTWGNWPWADQRLRGHPKFQWTESACRANHPNAHTILSMLQVCGLSTHLDIMHRVSLGVAQHICRQHFARDHICGVGQQRHCEQQGAGSVASHCGGLSVGQCNN